MTSTSYRIVHGGDSRSFPAPHAFLEAATPQGEARVFLGLQAGAALRDAQPLDACPFVAVELGNECLGVHGGESRGLEGSNLVGFARFRLAKQF